MNEQAFEFDASKLSGLFIEVNEDDPELASSELSKLIFTLSIKGWQLLNNNTRLGAMIIFS